MHPLLDQYDITEFEHDGLWRRVLLRGERPSIVVMSEAPGIYDAVIEFANRLVDASYRVYMPEILGQAGKPFFNGYVLKTMTRACITNFLCPLTFPYTIMTSASGAWQLKTIKSNGHPKRCYR